MKTLKLRIKDKHSKYLQQLAREVNLVWNYVNELGFKYWQRHKKFLSAYDIHEYTAGASKELNLHSQTIQAVSEELVTRRKQFNKVKLQWRVSNPKSPRRSLGWIPFKKAAIKYQNGQVRYGKQWFGLWDSYGLSKYHIRTGCFVQDARGRWYICLVVDNAPKIASTGTSAVGVDLGVKTLVTCSDGGKLAAPRIYRKYQPQLAIAQRAHKKQRVRAIHAKIKNIRNHELHVFTTQLVKKHAAICIGNVNAQTLAKTKLAKSVLDASWGSLKTMLKYQCANAGVWFEIVNAANTTQTCSCCNAKPGSSPKGRAGLGIREWTCVECGVTHDRDVNAAKNILALGHERLAGGIPCLQAGEDVNRIKSESSAHVKLPSMRKIIMKEITELDEMRPEYDFSGGIRGKHYSAYQQGTNVILLDPDIAKIFRDSEAVNHALRMLINLAGNELKRNLDQPT